MGLLSVGALLLLVVLLAAPQRTAGDGDAAARASGAADCSSVLRAFCAFNEREPAPYQEGSMVYFLHIPR